MWFLLRVQGSREELYSLSFKLWVDPVPVSQTGLPENPGRICSWSPGVQRKRPLTAHCTRPLQFRPWAVSTSRLGCPSWTCLPVVFAFAAFTKTSSEPLGVPAGSEIQKKSGGLARMAVAATSSWKQRTFATELGSFSRFDTQRCLAQPAEAYRSHAVAQQLTCVAQGVCKKQARTQAC